MPVCESSDILYGRVFGEDVAVTACLVVGFRGDVFQQSLVRHDTALKEHEPDFASSMAIRCVHSSCGFDHVANSSLRCRLLS